MKSTTSAIFAFAGLGLVAAHGTITNPPARAAGDAMKAACGTQMYNNQAADSYGNVQGELQVTQGQTDYDAATCNVWLCKGFKFDDNSANVQTFTAGQVVPITVDIRAPHTGTANVSIVSTKSGAGTIIGDILKSWDVYASNSATIPDDQKQFDITIPSDIGSQCSTAGDCVVQWFWNAASIDQTYESCIDFTVGGSGDSTPVSSAAPSASSAAAISAPAVTSAPASSATPTPTSVAVEATSTAAPVASATPTGGASNGTLPEEFTLDTFVAWLKEKAGTSSKKTRRATVHARPHARAF